MTIQTRHSAPGLSEALRPSEKGNAAPGQNKINCLGNDDAVRFFFSGRQLKNPAAFAKLRDLERNIALKGIEQHQADADRPETSVWEAAQRK